MILDKLENVKKTSSGWTARCPAHNDNRSSLSITPGDDGKLLVYCHAKCSTEAVVAKLGLAMRDLMPSSSDSGKHHSGGTAPKNDKLVIEATYDYRDEAGTLLYQVVRYDPKDFRQRKPKDSGGWSWSIGDVRRVLHRLRELISADSAELIFVVEGEKDVENLVRFGLVATCNAGGAGKWRPEYNEHFRGRRVVIIPDNDQVGRDHAQQVAAALHGIALEIKVVEIPGLRVKGDVSDWLGVTGTPAELRELVEAAPLWAPETASSAVGNSIQQEDEISLPEPVAWLVLDEAAFHGIAGEIVKAIEPESEADPVGILIQTLVMAGNLIGRNPHFKVEGSSHHVNLNAVLVGDTARGRKGTGEGRSRQVLAGADEEWVANNIKQGCVSGEGIIWNVRDEIWGLDKKGERVMTDEGITDKRLMLLESEFAAVLRVCRRETNTLSPTLRQAWDSGTLRTLAKNCPAMATNAHISVIGHITQQELRRSLTENDSFNGFGNRFLFVAVRRSKLLPDGGQDLNLDPYASRLHQIVKASRSVERMHRDPAAAALWRKAYAELADDDSTGLLAAVTSRAEAQVLRLSMIYALLDGSGTIAVGHLQAALAVWKYCRESAAMIFGNASGDALTERILTLVNEMPGISRTELHRKTSSNAKASDLVVTLARLRDAGKIRVEKIGAGGKPVERWFPKQAKELIAFTAISPTPQVNPLIAVNAISSQGWTEFSEFGESAKETLVSEIPSKPEEYAISDTDTAETVRNEEWEEITL